MSIRADAYQLCKTVWNSPSRDKIRDLIRSLNRIPEAGIRTETDRSHFGYMARKQNAQVLGYLMVDQERARLEKGPFPHPISPLRDQERQLLASAHNQFIQLNEQCVAPLTAELPKCTKAIDPYSQFPHSAPPAVSEGDVLAPEAIQAMATSFHQHPAINTALRGIEPVVDSLTEDQYMEAVLKLNDSFLKAGVLDAPKFTEITFTHSQDSPKRIIACRLVALICVRASLATLDQLIYQAILSNKLPVLNEDNIVRIREHTTHLAGGGLSIIYQPNEQAGITDLGYLVLVKCTSLKVPIDQLCRVERTNFKFSQDFGETVQVELREIDENLNPFGPLLDHI